MIKYLVFFLCLFSQSLLFAVIHPQPPAVVGVPTAVFVLLEAQQTNLEQAALALEGYRACLTRREERLRRGCQETLQRLEQLEQSSNNFETDNTAPRLFLAIGGISLLGWLGYLFWTRF